jgi:hypothetical protein
MECKARKEIISMKPNIRTILTLAIERGIDWGYTRAHKYTDTPDESRIKESIETEIWNEIDEVFDFEIKAEVLL